VTRLVALAKLSTERKPLYADIWAMSSLLALIVGAKRRSPHNPPLYYGDYLLRYIFSMITINI
jgi:hypothetical protein